ncbi:nitrogenase iron-molybdenum cofactor biosynthesis protein NifN [Methylophilus sp. 13]|uniref:nitrogenase iron-molybdenum cofactor biosynthesis protein NifN n=1 Tax=Methylophilus sp. 13 TaxID=2781018 RepID=UPI001890B4DB|nr:nitrogenase iron-molybdenum cofactor biosynthesis protein NifN [Methylophilus sp. 13]MBF5038544.1 nitrogenase iron-molybdenum cofactor biosynthesis protein NifN [Methylophilus sp. 13]
MAQVLNPGKACSVNPLKMSAPIGAALAFMGLQHCLPTLHGSQGCTSFGLVLFVRHFREMIPMQTTAMSEVTTILGGMDNIEQTIVNIWKRNQPSILGIASTGLTETKGDDVDAYLKLIAQKHPELADMHILYVSTPDYVGAFQDGWSKAVLKIVQHFAQPVSVRHARRVNVLAGSHLTPGDLQEIRDIVELFGLEAVIVPDISGSLDGHIPDDFTPTTLGGTTLEQLQTLGAARYTLAIGEQMRPAAQALEAQCGVPYRLFERLTGLAASDDFVQCLSELTGTPVPMKLRRQRSQCQDAMLDAHFYTGGKTVAIGAEPDMLWSYGQFLLEMGCDLRAVTTTHSPLLAQLPIEQVQIGDLEDLEALAQDCDLLLTHSHGRQLAERLHLPFIRIGIPTFDRIGAAHKVSVGYRGTRDLAFELANTFLAQSHEPAPDHWYPTPATEAGAASGCNSCTPAGSCHSASDMHLESTVHFS